MIDELDFYVEFYLETDDVGDEFTREADERLRAMTKNRNDIVGASVGIEKISKVETPYLYEVRIVLYKRPEYVAVVEKGPEPMVVLRNTLEAIERKVHENRERRSEAHTRKPEQVDMIVRDLDAQEVYATYVEDKTPSQLLDEGRTDIASRLMVEQGLSQEEAFFAADKILQAAQEILNGISSVQ
jgi:hypothetical protein